MNTFKVTTGFGYCKDSMGNIISKYVFDKGDHPLKEGYTMVEVPTIQELDNIQIYTPPPTWDEIRSTRDRLLLRSDWTQVLDTPLTDPQKLAWKIYRQALRDLPETFTDANKVIWPRV